MTTTLKRLAAQDSGISHLRDFCSDLIDSDKHPDGSFANRVARAVMDSLDTGKPAGTMRDWMLEHHGQYVTTIQARTDKYSVWAPTGRCIDAKSGATFVLFSGIQYGEPSRRSYSGMRVLRASDSVLIVGDESHVIAYIID